MRTEGSPFSEAVSFKGLPFQRESPVRGGFFQGKSPEQRSSFARVILPVPMCIVSGGLFLIQVDIYNS